MTQYRNHLIAGRSGSPALRVERALAAALDDDLTLDDGDIARAAYARDGELARRVAAHRDGVAELLCSLARDVEARIGATARERDSIHAAANAVDAGRWDAAVPETVTATPYADGAPSVADRAREAAARSDRVLVKRHHADPGTWVTA